MIKFWGLLINLARSASAYWKNRSLISDNVMLVALYFGGNLCVSE